MKKRLLLYEDLHVAGGAGLRFSGCDPQERAPHSVRIFVRRIKTAFLRRRDEASAFEFNDSSATDRRRLDNVTLEMIFFGLRSASNEGTPRISLHFA